MKLQIKNPVLKKILIINAIIIGGLILANIVVLVKNMLGIEVKPIVSDMTLHSDFTDVIRFSVGKFKRWATGNYFPFTYVIMSTLEFFSSGNYKLMYYMVLEVCALMYILYCRHFLKDHMGSRDMYMNIIIFLFLQFPMLFVVQRGNIEVIMLLFCMLFYVLYKKEKYNWAAIALSLAACMKLYPALLAMLFISKKRWKAFFLCAISTIVITVISYFRVDHVLGGFSHYLSGFSNFLNVLGDLLGMQYNHSLLFGIYYLIFKFGSADLPDIFSSSIMTAYTIGIICIAIPLILYTTFKKMDEWKKVTLFSLMIVSFPQVSFDYTLILLIIPIIEFVTDINTKKWENITYPILFGLLLIPMNFTEEIVHGVAPNVGLILKPLTIIAIMVLIINSSRNKAKIKEEGKEVPYIES